MIETADDDPTSSLKDGLAEAYISLANLTRDTIEQERLYTRAKEEGGEKVRRDLEESSDAGFEDSGRLEHELMDEDTS